MSKTHSCKRAHLLNNATVCVCGGLHRNAVALGASRFFCLAMGGASIWGLDIPQSSIGTRTPPLACAESTPWRPSRVPSPSSPKRGRVNCVFSGRSPTPVPLPPSRDTTSPPSLENSVWPTTPTPHPCESEPRTDGLFPWKCNVLGAK